MSKVARTDPGAQVGVPVERNALRSARSTRGRELLAALRARRNARNVAGQRRFGIVTRHEQLGVDMPTLRVLARPHRRDHALALELWDSGVMEAMLCATFIADPRQLTSAQMERWVRAADSWNLTDALACLFDRTALAEKKARAWSGRRAEFVKRTAFALMAEMAVHRKELPDEIFLGFLPMIRREANDARNFVKKAVNWALRQIGKRNPRLRRAAIAETRRILRLDTPPARWIARDALRELGAEGRVGTASPASTHKKGPAVSRA